ncbi:MAG: hypothetical protein IPQ18_04805 [Saprospiraceae bacterium]|jgi:hypothetical protein|nr:hypothetical protein [Saprospiraceae bacterium]
MVVDEILQSIKELPFHERLSLIEKALKTLHEPSDRQLIRAANKLRSDYMKDDDLTSFTALDYEKFYEAR